jgi:hypothetical protein
LEVFDSCGQSMEQMAINLQELKVHGPDVGFSDEVADATVDEFDFTQLTEFIHQGEYFWDELLTMQNEVRDCSYVLASFLLLYTVTLRSHGAQVPHNDGSKLVIEGTVPNQNLAPSDCSRVLEDMLSVFDEFEGEIAELQANLLGESRDARESELLSPCSVDNDTEEDDISMVSVHVSSSPDCIKKVMGKPEEGEGSACIAKPNSSPEPSPPTDRISSFWRPAEKVAISTAALEGCQAPTAAALRHGNAWDDLDVMQLKPTKQVLANSSCLDAYDHSPEGVALRLIASQLEAQALRPINVPRLLNVAATGAGLVAYSAWYGTNANAAAATLATHPRVLGVLWMAGFAANVAAVSLPGRLDRMYSEKTHLKPWQSLFEPSNWAFAIWAVIYLLEAGTTVGVLIALNGVVSAPVREVARRLLPLWMGGNATQALWCFLFRPEFSSRLWAPMLCLFLAAACFCAAHAKVDAGLELGDSLNQLQGILPTCEGASSVCSGALGLWEWGLVLALRTALSTHSMWLLVSAVVTLNSWLTVSYGERVRGLLPSAGFLSAFVLFLAGTGLSASRGDPMFALTTAWALDATAHRSMQKTTMVPSPLDKKAVSSDVHETLAGVETLLSGAAKCVAAGTMVMPVVRILCSFMNL